MKTEEGATGDDVHGHPGAGLGEGGAIPEPVHDVCTVRLWDNLAPGEMVVRLILSENSGAAYCST